MEPKGGNFLKKELRALLLGDYKEYSYHPFAGIDVIFRNLLSDYMDVACTEQRGMLEYENLKEYHLLISYADNWKDKLTGEQAGGVISFAAMGGGILAVHNGISLQGNHECAKMLGARFIDHPPYQRLEYAMRPGSHPITEGLSGFEMDEELYIFEMDVFNDITVLMDCTGNNTIQPAAWAQRYGMGRVVYLAPGHDIRSFQNPVYLEMIKRSALWAAKAI